MKKHNVMKCYVFRNQVVMNPLDILKYVDHTLLKAFASWDEIQVLCDEAILYKTASVCIPPNYIKRIYDTY